MTELNYYGAPPTLPHRGGLIGWGAVLICVGALFSFSALFTLVLGIVLLVKWSGTSSFDGQTIVAVFVQSVSAGTMSAGAIWLGVGSCRGRRWAKPLLVAGSWMTLVYGVIVLIPMGTMLVALFNQAPQANAPAVPKPILMLGAGVGVVMTTLLFIGVPAGLIAWFRQPTVDRTLALLDPVPRWTDSVPIPRLIWALTCAFLGLGVVVASVSGMWIWFTMLVQGTPALLGMIVGAGLVAAGYRCLRRSSAAWVVSNATFTLLVASSVTFAIAGDKETYREQLIRRTATFSTLFTPTTAGATAPPPNTAEFVSRVNPAVVPSILYGAALVFGLWVRRSVVDTPREPGRETM